MNIRKATKFDFSAIENIYNQTKLDELQFEDKNFKLLPIRQDNKRLTGLLESDIYVFENEINNSKEICGFGAIYHSKENEESEIRVLQVHPFHRGKGIGTHLLEFLLNHPNSFKNISLNVVHTNHPAKFLYNKFGFKIIETFLTDYNQQDVYADKMARY